MTRGRRVALLLALCAASLDGRAAAAQATADTAGPTVSGAPQISLITFGPGHNPWRVWELFGHNMIRVTDSAAGTDIAYNFGMFDFGQKNFFWNFLQGRMWYWMQGDNPKDWLRGYARAGRSIEIQELALSPDQARSLAGALARNAQPDQMYYRYEPYRDNCSTRVRDALDLSLGGALERDLSALASGATFRSRTAELTAGSAPIYFGLMLLLGPSTDQPLSAWEDSFIPMNFAGYLQPVTTPAPAGGAVPLVKAAGTRPGKGEEPRAPRSPESLLGLFLAVGVLIGGALGWSGARSGAGRGRGPFLVLGSLWSLVSGGAGFLMVYLWAFTDHTYAWRNENLLQASVLGLVLFVLMAGWARRGGPAPASVRAVAATIAVLSVAGVVLQLLPWFSQVNGPALLFFVPANLGMALGAARAAPATTGPT